MKASASRGREAGTGLIRAWRVCQNAPDPPGLENVRGNNAKALRRLAKLVVVMCDGRPGTRVYLGSVSLATLLGTHQRTAHRWVRQLEVQGVIRRIWTGRPCKKGEDGKPLAGGKPIDRATEFVFVGLPTKGG